MAQANPEVKYVASVRTALSGPDECLMRQLPKAYVSQNVKDVLEYLTTHDQLTDDEVAVAGSVREEMKSDYTVAVNGTSARSEDKVRGLFTEREHQNVPYKALDMEIASVQEGGLASLLQ
ncbi:hypothetical protein GOV14_02435 [Candidatus Pacearchaeota archaeon]|nr:hypothetical protein [Candidatus Pacearchaeota archaeon]